MSLTKKKWCLSVDIAPGRFQLTSLCFRGVT
jgi:hypothetical protein